MPAIHFDSVYSCLIGYISELTVLDSLMCCTIQGVFVHFHGLLLLSLEDFPIVEDTCDLEDATDLVCGLIRDLTSLK